MKATKYILIFLGISLFLYVVVINLISTYYLPGQNNNTEDSNSYSGNQIKLNVGDSVSVSIIRNRWYGKIYEEGGSKILYIFDKLRMPIETNGRNYILSHIIFISFWFLILIITLIFEFIFRGEIKKENIYIQEESN